MAYKYHFLAEKMQSHKIRFPLVKVYYENDKPKHYYPASFLCADTRRGINKLTEKLLEASNNTIFWEGDRWPEIYEDALDMTPHPGDCEMELHFDPKLSKDVNMANIMRGLRGRANPTIVKDFIEFRHSNVLKEYIEVPDIRNKLSSITALISMLESDYDGDMSTFIEGAKRSVNYLARREVYSGE